MRTQTAILFLACSACAFIAKAQTVAIAGPDQETCFDTTSMQANAPLPTESGSWSLTSGMVTITDPSDPNTSITGIYFGQNVLTWTIFSPTDTTTDQVNLIRYVVDPSFSDAGPDQTIYAPPYTATMGATPVYAPQVCTWSVVQGTGTFSNVNNPLATVTDLSEGENIFRWTSDNGPCTELFFTDVVFTVLVATGIDTDTNHRPLAMWFDQNSGVLKIVGDVQANSLSIVNALGQRVDARARPSAGSLDLSGLPPGSYAATATISGTHNTLRFVVAR